MKTTVGIFLILNKTFIVVAHPTLHNPLQWDIIKGCQDENELPIETIEREFYEETSLKLFEDVRGKIIECNNVYLYKYKKKKLIPFFMLVNHYVDLLKFKCNSFVNNDKNFPEIDAFSMITYDERWILHETQVRALEDFQGKYKIFSEQNNTKDILKLKSQNYG